MSELNKRGTTGAMKSEPKLAPLDTVLAKVDTMSALCSDGRAQVKDLLRSMYGEKVMTKPKAGQVWKRSNNGLYILAVMNSKAEYAFICLQYGCRWKNAVKLTNLDTSPFEFVANSLDEYYKLKAEGRLP